MKNILFLDIDGVINIVFKKGYEFDSRPIKQLKRVILESNCYLVISSTWRKTKTLKWLREKFKEWGIAKSRVLGVTPNLEKRRGYEIDTWLDKHKHKVRNYVIVDDDSDMEMHISKLIQTHTFQGLTKERADRIVELFRMV